MKDIVASRRPTERGDGADADTHGEGAGSGSKCMMASHEDEKGLQRLKNLPRVAQLVAHR